MKEGDLVPPCFYLDTSAIVKRYWNENGTDFLNELYEFSRFNKSLMYTARHSIAEVGSTAYRLHREGNITRENSASIIKRFMQESINALLFIETDSSLYDYSLIALSNHPLTAGDAMQLAAALDAYSLHGQDLHFVCNDNRLCDAAHSEGLQVLKPGEEEAMKYLNGLILPENGEEKKSPGDGD